MIRIDYHCMRAIDLTYVQAVIIEDESAAVRLLSNILAERHPHITVSGTASSVAGGRELLAKTQPDLVFLDIELQDGKGFDLTPQIQAAGASLVFVTAYQQYALRSYDYDAVDHILKPYSIGQVARAVDRVKTKTNPTTDQRIAIKSLKGSQYVNRQTIIRCEADNTYTKVHLVDGTIMVMTTTLKQVESLIDDPAFYRCHTSHLVNTRHIKALAQNDELPILLSMGDRLPLARRRKKGFMEIMATRSEY